MIISYPNKMSNNNKKTIIKKNNNKELSSDNDENDNEELVAKKEKRNVLFRSKVRVKAPTLLNSKELQATIIRDENIIRSLKNKNEINDYGEKLMKEVEEIEKMEKEKYDKLGIKEKYDVVEYKIQLLNDVKAKLLAEGSEQIKSNETKLENTEKEFVVSTPRKLSPNSKAIGFNNQKSTHNNFSTQNINDYLESIYNVIDIVVIYNCCVAEKAPCELIEQFHGILQKFNKLRIAVYIYGKKRFLVSEFFDKSQLQKLNNIALEPVDQDIRNNIINMKWREKSLKIACYIVSSTCKDKKIDSIILKDPVQEVMDCMKILNYICLIDKNQEYEFKYVMCTIKSLDEFYKIRYFQKMIEAKKEEFIKQNLYNLKRMIVSSNDELIKNINKSHKQLDLGKHEEVIIYKFNSNLDPTDILEHNNNISMRNFDKLDENIHEIKDFKLKKVIEPNYLYEASLLKVKLDGNVKAVDKKIWIETFSNEIIYFTIFEIYETTKYFCRLFNQKYGKNYLEVPETYLLKSASKYMFAQFSESLSKPKLTLSKHIDVLEAFTHFTYDVSKNKLLIFDLRTIQIEENKYLLTEPIIFCKNNEKFGASNLGENFISVMWSRHICNEICGKTTSNFHHENDEKTDCQIL